MAEAAKVKDWKETRRFYFKTHAPALGPAGVAYAAS